MKILLVGGGSGGSVSPLLAVRQYIAKHQPNAEFFFIGTRTGPERAMVKKENMSFYSVPAGKWRRYFSLINFYDLFVTPFGFFKALHLLKKIRPDVLFSAGSFVSVPVAYAAYLLKIKIVIHQQDVIPTLSNKLVYPIADKLTVSLEKSAKDFYTGSGFFRKLKKTKIVYTGNPIRPEITSGKINRARELFNLRSDLPTLLVLGGGTGSESLNKIVADALPDLTKYFQIIHQTGKNKKNKVEARENYFQKEFLYPDELPHAIKIADIVISRAGFSYITELAACKKVCIIIPLPNSHQIYNAHYLIFQRAAIVAPQEAVTTQTLIATLRKLLFDVEAQKYLKKSISKLMPRDADKKIGELIISLCSKHTHL